MAIFPHNEQNLFSRITEGDEAAFGILFNSSIALLHPFIISLVKTEDAAREIIQEAFMRVWLHREKLAEIENPGGWLYRVASNECYTYLRKQARENKLVFDAAATHTSNKVYVPQQLELKDLKKSIAEAVNLLPPKRKRIYQLSRNECLKIDEIAAHLNLSTSTVKNALVFALKFIREHLVKKGHLLQLIFF